jgi:antirestriction protein ArdC
MTMNRKEEQSRADIYARITDRIVADLERAFVHGRSHGLLPTPLAASLGRSATTANPIAV